jgi:CDP-diacylglycerol--serine O-phosphatidyltransferase
LISLTVFVARALGSSSNLGGQLDSLADMVSFGFLPGFTMFIALVGNQYTDLPWYYYLGFLVTLFSCLRLAIFNLDEEQKYYFKGLNTPSNTILISDYFMLTKNPAISVFF